MLDWKDVSVITGCVSSVIGLAALIWKTVVKPAAAWVEALQARHVMMLNKTRETVRQLIYVLAIGHFELDEKGRMVDSNRPFRHMAGHGPEYLNGFGYQTLMREIDRNYLNDIWANRGEFNQVVIFNDIRCVMTVWPSSTGGYIGALQPIDSAPPQRRNLTPKSLPVVRPEPQLGEDG